LSKTLDPPTPPETVQKGVNDEIASAVMDCILSPGVDYFSIYQDTIKLWNMKGVAAAFVWNGEESLFSYQPNSAYIILSNPDSIKGCMVILGDKPGDGAIHRALPKARG